MTPVERLRAAEALLREAVENSRKMRESAPEHERMVFDFMSESLAKRGFRVIADIADERIILAMADILASQAKRAEMVTSWRQRDMFYGQEDEEKAHLALADALLGGGGA